MELLEEEKQYLVAESADSQSPQGKVLAQFLDKSEKTPDVNIIRISGNRANPTLVVLKTTPQTMESLRSEFRDQLIFEEDKPLSLL